MTGPRDEKDPGERAHSAWDPRELGARIRAHLVQDLRDVVMTRELVEERFAQKTALRVLEGDRRAVGRLCREHAELRRLLPRCESYLDNGYRALLAEVDGRLVGHVWWHDHLVPPACAHPHLTRYRLRLEPGQVWGFDLFLVERARGGGASNDFFALFRRHLRGLGYTRVFGHVDAGNTPAVWLHKLQGYKPVRTVEARLYAGVLLRSEGQILLRNPPFGVRQKFDFRLLRGTG